MTKKVSRKVEIAEFLRAGDIITWEGTEKESVVWMKDEKGVSVGGLTVIALNGDSLHQLRVVSTRDGREIPKHLRAGYEEPQEEPVTLLSDSLVGDMTLQDFPFECEFLVCPTEPHEAWEKATCTGFHKEKDSRVALRLFSTGPTFKVPHRTSRHPDEVRVSKEVLDGFGMGDWRLITSKPQAVKP